MKRIILSIPLLLYMIFPSINYAQDSTGYLEIPGKFFSIMKQKGNDEAIDFLFKNNKYLRMKLPDNLKIKNELNKIVKLLGNFYGSDLINVEKAGENYIRLYYLARYDRQPLLFTFTMYRPQKKWRVQQLQFSEKIGDYLDKNK